MDGNASFGHWLQRRRNALRLTQRELAQQVGCAAVTIRKIEADERRPSVQIAQRLAARLALAPAERAAFLRSARAELCADQLPEPTNIAGLPTPPRRFTNLPAAATPLIGREQDAATVEERLRRVNVRLLTLIGSPGIGKTRLGLQVASDLIDAFDDGCCFVALAPIHDPSLVATAIAQPLGVQELASRPLVERLKHYLSDRQMLLVLDNFEQVAAAASLVAELLAAAPRLKVLVTSRAALHLSGEHEYVVPPLALPDLKALPSPANLARYAAVDLFVQRAQAVAPGFALTSANAAAVAAICHHLDGLPLAIELAAARIKLLALPALLARLDHRLSLLTGGARDLPPHQQTLRSTIDWSYDLLDQSEQTLFRRLAVFVAGCTLEAAEAVCGSWEIGVGGWGTDAAASSPISQLPTPTLDGLAALLDKSLLQQTEATDGAGRFGMLETIHEYAQERLEQSGEAEVLRQRHTTYYLALAEEAQPHLRDSEQDVQGVWLDRLELELDNLRAALEWSKTTVGKAEMGLRLAAALGWFWKIRGHLSEGRAWLAEFLALTGTTTAPIAARAQAFLAVGVLAEYQSDYAAARAAFEQSQTLACELGDTLIMTWSDYYLGQLSSFVGDYAAARIRIEQSLAIWQATGNQAGVDDALQQLGSIAWFQGDLSMARTLYRQSLRSELRDQTVASWGLNKLADVARAEGDYEEAAALYQDSLAFAQKLGDKYHTLWALHNLGELARYQRDYVRAAALYDESLGIARDIGYTSGIASMLNRLGEVAQAQGDDARATALHRESLSVFHDLGQKRDSALCLDGLAWVAEAQGHARRAAVLYGAVAVLREATGAQEPPLDRANYARSVDRVRDRLGDGPFAEAWAEGCALTLEQAIAYAVDTRA